MSRYAAGPHPNPLPQGEREFAVPATRLLFPLVMDAGQRRFHHALLPRSLIDGVTSMAAKAAGMIDVHFHLIPQFYRDAVYEAGRGPAIGRYPDWSPQLALDLMDGHGIALAITSIAQPGVAFMPDEKAADFARRCNDYAAELIAQYPQRFGCFGLVPTHDMATAVAEARYCLETLRFEGI